MKKLKLKKEIIALLSDNEAKQINGGGVYQTEGTCWCLPSPIPPNPFPNSGVQCHGN